MRCTSIGRRWPLLTGRPRRRLGVLSISTTGRRDITTITSPALVAVHYQTFNGTGAACDPTGTTGEWNAATGRSNGWQEWSIDLSDYVGRPVEVSISYASDWGAQGIGAWLDDVSGGATESFEVDLGEWVVTGAPSGSTANPNDWARTTDVGYEEGAIVAMSPDNAAFRTVYFGFGLEGVTSAAERNDLMGRALAYLL